MPFVQCAFAPQSGVSEQGHPAWFAKQRPPVQWMSCPQSSALWHSRDPAVGQSGAGFSTMIAGLLPPQATTTTTARVERHAGSEIFMA